MQLIVNCYTSLPSPLTFSVIHWYYWISVSLSFREIPGERQDGGMIEFMGPWKKFYERTTHGLNSNLCPYKTTGELLLKISYFVFLIFESGERRQVLLHKLMENSLFYRKIIGHRTNKNIGNCFPITKNWFKIQWVSMYKFLYLASSKASPHTGYRMGQDFCITSYFIYAYSSLFNQTIAKIVELLWDLSAFSN